MPTPVSSLVGEDQYYSARILCAMLLHGAALFPPPRWADWGGNLPLPRDGGGFGWGWDERFFPPHPHLPPRWGEGNLKSPYLPQSAHRGGGAIFGVTLRGHCALGNTG
jgi:hypothetical protein